MKVRTKKAKLNKGSRRYRHRHTRKRRRWGNTETLKTVVDISILIRMPNAVVSARSPRTPMCYFTQRANIFCDVYNFMLICLFWMVRVGMFIKTCSRAPSWKKTWITGVKRVIILNYWEHFRCANANVCVTNVSIQ